VNPRESGRAEMWRMNVEALMCELYSLYIAPFLQYSMSVMRGRTRTANIDAPELSPYGTQLKLPRNCTPVKHYMLEILEPVEIVQCSIGLYKEIIHDPKILEF